MRVPLLLFNGVDVEVFSGAEELEKYVEPEDVENGEYCVFDADGRLLELRVVRSIREPDSILDRILGSRKYVQARIAVCCTGVFVPDELREKLIAYAKWRIARHDGFVVRGDPNSMSISELIELIPSP